MVLQQKYKDLKQKLASLESVCIAFSGGVDSTLLLYVAHQVLGDRAMGITLQASMYSKREMEEAKEFVKKIGVRHLFIDADEYNIPEFVENDKERCYYCKKAIFTNIRNVATEYKMNYVADGTIADDVFDYRPGMRALKELGVISPLKAVGLTKVEVRALSKQLNLPTWGKPSMACLASRIPYGVKITPQRLALVEKGERYLFDHGFTQFRVRYHHDIARIEIIPKEEARFLSPDFKAQTIAYFKEIGFTYVVLDLGGYRVGSMNEVLQGCEKMEKEKLITLLESVKNNSVSIEDALKTLKILPYGELGYAKIDHHRALRNGYPEVIYCEGKEIEHIKGIVTHMLEHQDVNILGTRASQEVYEAIREITEDVTYYPLARCVVVKRVEIPKIKHKIIVVTGGTADIAVAEEAVITAETLGNTVERLYDVGVAGLHRLLANMDQLLSANVVVVVAGMEGALASVVGGLVDKPVIAVPTSIGYGASFKGVAALLSMLNSCASGVSVVNIDNGFGAGYTASMINKLSYNEDK